MPIAMLCPRCDGILNAPDHAAGKKARCPKCSQLMLVPKQAAAEVIEGDFELVEEPPPPPVKKQESYRVAEERPRVEREEDRPPRRRKKVKKPKSAAQKIGAVIGIIFGVLVILAPIARVIALIIRVDRIANRADDNNNNNIDNAAPVISRERLGMGTPKDVSHEWVPYINDGYGISASFPGGPPKLDMGKFGGRKMNLAATQGSLFVRSDGGRLYFFKVFVTMVPRDAKAREDIFNAAVQVNEAGTAMQIVGDTQVGEYPAKIFRGSGPKSVAYGRIVLTKFGVLIFGVEGEPSMAETDAAVMKYLADFQITK